MKIRTALVLACFLLSVLPLGVIVVYSYFASGRALESAYHAEATKLTAQMDRRLTTLRDELQERLAEVSALPNPSEGNVLMTMGDAASLVDSLEIHPIGPAAAPHPMVMRMPRFKAPRFSFSDAQHAQLKKISQLGREMGSHSLTPEQRGALQKQLNDAQTTFNDSMQEAQKEFSKNLEAHLQQAEKHREEAMRIAEQKREQQFDVGNLQAHVSTDRVIHRILNASPEDADERNEIAFAIDRGGNVYTRSEDERQKLDALGIPQRIAAGKQLNDIRNWVVVLRRDPQSGLQVGVARPYGEDLEGLRKTAAKNFGYGIALIFVALIGIVPIANHITGDVELVTRGAERIAHGDLSTRLPVHSKNEIGQLATAFNRMAEDLSVQQQ